MLLPLASYRLTLGFGHATPLIAQVAICERESFRKSRRFCRLARPSLRSCLAFWSGYGSPGWVCGYSASLQKASSALGAVALLFVNTASAGRSVVWRFGCAATNLLCGLNAYDRGGGNVARLVKGLLWWFPNQRARSCQTPAATKGRPRDQNRPHRSAPKRLVSVSRWQLRVIAEVVESINESPKVVSGNHRFGLWRPRRVAVRFWSPGMP